MRKALSGFFASIFSLAASITIPAVIFFLLFGTPALIKSSLDESKIYFEIPKFIDSQLMLVVSQNPSMAPLRGAIADELDPEYVQLKFEDFINQSYDYAKGEREKLPSVSLADLRQRVGSRYPALYRLPEEITQIFDQEYKISQQQGDTIKNGYKWVRLVSLYGAAISVLCLLLVWVLGANLKDGARNVSKLLFKMSIFGLISSLIGLFILYKAPIPALNLPDNLAFLEQPLTAFVVLITQKSLTYFALIYSVLAFAGAVLFFSSRQPKPEQEQR